MFTRHHSQTASCWNLLAGQRVLPHAIPPRFPVPRPTAIPDRQAHPRDSRPVEAKHDRLTSESGIALCQGRDGGPVQIPTAGRQKCQEPVAQQTRDG